GIGTSSRLLPDRGSGFVLANPEIKNDGGYTIGVLVQTNFGGRLTIAGVPVWKTLQPNQEATLREGNPTYNSAHGSCMIVVATDAPLDARQLRRLAARAMLGM